MGKSLNQKCVEFIIKTNFPPEAEARSDGVGRASDASKTLDLRSREQLFNFVS